MSSPAGLPDLHSLSNLDHPEETESRTRVALEQLKSSSAFDRSEEIKLMLQLVRALGLQGKLPEAKIALAEVETLLKGSDYPVSEKIGFLLEQGRLAVLNKTPSQALPLFSQAWELAREAHEDFYAIDAAQLMATVETQKSQKEWVRKALSVAETSTQPAAKSLLTSLYTTVGWSQYDQRQFENALVTFKQAVQSVEPSEDNRKNIIAANWAVAKTLRALGKLDEALELQKDLQVRLNQLNVRDGYVYEELAECLHTMKKPAEAEPYFALAYSELSKDAWLKDNNPARLRRLKELGKVKGPEIK